MLHYMVVEHPGPVAERSAESVHADTRHMKICGVLRKPVHRDGHNRMSQDTEVLRQRNSHARSAARHEGQEIYPSMFSSMVCTRAEMSTFSPTYPWMAAFCVDGGRPP